MSKPRSRRTQAEIDRQLARVNKAAWMPHFKDAAIRHAVPLHVLLAIASRETEMGGRPPLSASWTGDHGHGRGIMQIDDRYHKAYIQAHRNDDHRANILYGAKVLADALKALRGDLRHAISAYNCGVSRVQQALREGKDSDAYTTGRDYASDVLGRADLVRLRVSPAIRAPISLVPIALALGLALTHYQK